MMIVRYRPRKESATKAPKSGKSDAVPNHTFTLAAAFAVD